MQNRRTNCAAPKCTNYNYFLVERKFDSRIFKVCADHKTALIESGDYQEPGK